jgi:hypothetical protein
MTTIAAPPSLRSSLVRPEIPEFKVSARRRRLTPTTSRTRAMSDDGRLGLVGGEDLERPGGDGD